MRQVGADYLDRLIYSPPSLPSMQVTEGLLLAMRDDVHADQARFLLASSRARSRLTLTTPLRDEFLRKLGGRSIFYPDDLSMFAAQNGIRALALAPKLLERARREGRPLHGFSNATPGFGHWNERGHRVVAELLSIGTLHGGSP